MMSQGEEKYTYIEKKNWKYKSQSISICLLIYSIILIFMMLGESQTREMLKKHAIHNMHHCRYFFYYYYLLDWFILLRFKHRAF